MTKTYTVLVTDSATGRTLRHNDLSIFALTQLAREEQARTVWQAIQDSRGPRQTTGFTAQLEHSTVVLENVHDPDKCDGDNCTVHNRSSHHMRSWPQHWRGDRGIMERIDPETGIGHPDPDNPWPEGDSRWIHGCDGGCAAPKTLYAAGSLWGSGQKS